METPEEIRQRKLEQLQEMQQQRFAQARQEQSVLQQQVEMLEQFIRTRLTREALARYGNIRAANPEKAIQLLAVLGQTLQSTDQVVDDEQLKDILIRMAPERRSTKFIRK
jgi:DNA-binding TFAR19-related protein (PDSD5 family)